MNRNRLFARLIVGSMVELAGLLIIVFLAMRQNGIAYSPLGAGLLLFVIGAFIALTAALQLRALNRP